MGMHIDTEEAGHADEARALLEQVADDGYVSLGVLSGADLCVLGATEHPVCWEALKTAWLQFNQEERERVTQSRTLAMFRRGLIIQQPPGRGVYALFLPAYKVSASLGILIAARKSPAFMIATHHESRTPAVTYFQLRESNAVVQEIPERADNDAAGQPPTPLELTFSYRLSTQAFAAAELARWALKPVPAARYKPKPPRLISFFAPTDEGSPLSYQLTVHAHGKKAHVDAPDVSANLTAQELTAFMTDAVTKWATSCAIVPPPEHQRT